MGHKLALRTYFIIYLIIYLINYLFIYLFNFMAKSGAQTLTFKSLTIKQKGKQENSTFFLKNSTWHGDRGPRARSCTSKTFGVWRIVSLLGVLNVSGNPTT